MVEVDDLAREIRRLRRGWGLRAINPDNVGILLRTLCGATLSDISPEVGARVLHVISAGLADLPAEARLALSVGLCLYQDAEFRQFEDRVEWLAAHLQISQRTAIRRIDESAAILASELWRKHQASLRNRTWYVESLSTVLRLDAARPEALERRTIVSMQDGLDSIITTVGVPRQDVGATTRHGLDVEILYGGVLEDLEREQESVFRQRIVFPSSLQADDRHEYLLRRAIPAGQIMAPHYVHVPLRRSDHFEVRIRFSADAIPDAVWVLRGVPPAAVYERTPTSEVVRPDRANEVFAKFDGLVQGYGYGLSWSVPAVAG